MALFTHFKFRIPTSLSKGAKDLTISLISYECAQIKGETPLGSWRTTGGDQSEAEGCSRLLAQLVL